MFIYNPIRIQFEQLKNQSVNDLQCPCSKVAIKYSEFINFDATYHQLCSSVFVTNLWYNGYEIWNISEPCIFPSFANLAFYYFSLLSTFCQSANKTILNSLIQFYALEYITSDVVLENQFNNEVISIIELFKIRTQSSFRGQWNLIQSVIFNNQLATVRRTNVIFHAQFIGNTTEMYSNIVEHNNCTCGTNSMCHENIAFCNDGKLDYIIGMYIGCYMVDSLLRSTTECFFDETCINIIKSYVIQSTELYQQLNILNISEISQYKRNETIEIIVDNLFIENWNEFYSYDNYYKQCKPLFCSYTIQVKPNYIYILTRLLSVYAGLTIVIRFLVQNIVNLIRRQKNQQSAISISNRIYLFFQITKTKLLNLNLFQDRSTNHEKIRKQIWTTRLYLVIFIIILFILVLYTSLNKKSININVQLSSLTQYQQLEIKYKSTLTCPCDRISIEYKEFIELKVSYHEVCTSDFISQQWFDYLYNKQRINDRNFLATASIQFQVLASLCKLTQETINISLTQFYSTKFISGQLNLNETFQKQINSILKIFQRSISQTFKRTLDMIHEVIHGNFYMTIFQTNWKFTVLERKRFSPFYTNPLTYNNSCNCGTSSKCSEKVILNNSIIDGLVIGCYPFESMLQSSLQCLYNQTCLELILLYFKVQSDNITFNILSSINQYGIDEKVEHMVDRLFVDQWYIDYSYEKYFQQCYPTFCTYSYIQYFNIFYIITTILSLYSGLTITLTLIIPFIIHILFRLFYRRKTFITPLSQTFNQNID
ncbi:unnamed protein product [Rotaria sp. Silwood1]|nr:unnamed protein product [Rotaria sp. Silwood1]